MEEPNQYFLVLEMMSKYNYMWLRNLWLKKIININYIQFVEFVLHTNLYTCTCTYIHTYCIHTVYILYTYIHTHIHTYIHTYIHVHTSETEYWSSSSLLIELMKSEGSCMTWIEMKNSNYHLKIRRKERVEWSNRIHY